MVNYAFLAGRGDSVSVYTKTRPKAPEKNLEGSQFAVFTKNLDFSRLQNEIRMCSLVPGERNNPPNNFARRTHVDILCIKSDWNDWNDCDCDFVDFFVFPCAELSTSFLVSPSLASARSILFVFQYRLKVHICNVLAEKKHWSPALTSERCFASIYFFDQLVGFY